MVIGVVKETDENRIAIVPEMMGKFADLGYQFNIESGAGKTAGFGDDLFGEANIMRREEVLSKSEIIVSNNPLAITDYEQTQDGAVLISLFAPYFDDAYTKKLIGMGKKVVSMDMIPRTTLAQSMDTLSTMASLSGYKAVIRAADELPSYFPMMTTAAGTIKPARVVILGAGVAGLQAIATAKRLGAVVEAFDPRLATKEEVMSLGAKFIEVEGAVDDKDAGGYAVAQSEEYLEKQRILVQEKAMKADVIITTAQVRGRKAPLLVPASTVERMQPGSVIVDLAASTGGNCELTLDGQTIVHNGIKIIGNSQLASSVAKDASYLYANNIYNFLKLATVDKKLDLEQDHEIITGGYMNHKASKDG